MLSKESLETMLAVLAEGSTSWVDPELEEKSRRIATLIREIQGELEQSRAGIGDVSSLHSKE